jgi:hypothetical protein
MRNKFRIKFFSLISLNKKACKEIGFLYRPDLLSFLFLFRHKKNLVWINSWPKLKERASADIRESYDLANVHIYKLTCNPTFTLKPLVIKPLVTKYF